MPNPLDNYSLGDVDTGGSSSPNPGTSINPRYDLTDPNNAFAGYNYMDKYGNAYGENSTLVGTFWNDLTGKNSQMREFAQQEYMLDKQYAHDDERAQMARMVAAGINPNTAGSAIAGSNVGQSAPGVASATQGGSNALNALTGAITGVGALGSEIDKNRAEAFKAGEEGRTVSETRELNKKEIATRIHVNDATATSIEKESVWIDQDHLSLYALNDATIANLNAQVSLYNEQIEEIQAKIRNLDAETNKENYLALQADLINQQLTFRNNLIQQLGYDPYNATDNTMLQFIMEGRWDDYNNALSYFYDRAYEEGDAAFEFGQAMSDYDMENEITKMLNELNNEWAKPASNPFNLIEKYTRQFINLFDSSKNFRDPYKPGSYYTRNHKPKNKNGHGRKKDDKKD